MRGKHLRIFLVAIDYRITPACAGKTVHKSRNAKRPWDHPRMCGENPLRFVLADTHKGSPPHVRGKLRLLLALSNPLGITPACAGKTRNLPLKRRQRRDHPRMCGENNKQSRFWALLRGSPPHVRGKQLEKANETKWYRITPACAGKTAIQNKNLRESQDHPRMCGENVSITSGKIAYVGSPPHVRGKHLVFAKITRNVGITPACAGKTETVIDHLQKRWDHPRMCGENH